MANQDFRVKNGLQVGVGGTVFTADIGGKVGINSASPTATLDIQGTVNSSGTITAPTFAGTATTATNLSDAANITTGTISPDRLSGTYNISVSGSVSGDTIAIGTATVSNSITVGPIGSATTFVRADSNGNLIVTGIITASSFSGNASSATYATSAGIATNATYASTAGIATYSTNSGVSTNVIGGIGSITQLSVSGVTTTSILNVGTGGTVITTTASGLVGIGTTRPTSTLDVRGEISIGKFDNSIYGINPSAVISAESTSNNNNIIYFTAAEASDGSPATGNRLSIGINTTSNYSGTNAPDLFFVGEDNIITGNSIPKIKIANPNYVNDDFYSLEAVYSGAGGVNPPYGYIRNELYDATYSIALNGSFAFSVGDRGSTSGTRASNFSSGNEAFVVLLDGSTSLFYNKSKKFETSGVGATVYGNLNVGTGGTVITTTAAGFVGVGTTNPISKLHVQGDTYLDGGLDIAGDIQSVGNINVSDTKTLSFTGGSSVFSNPHITIAALNTVGNLYELYAYDVTSGTDYVLEVIKTNVERQTLIGGTGKFIIGPNSSYPVTSTYAFKVDLDAETSLYYNQSEKLATTNTGISILNGASDTVTVSGPRNIIIDPDPVGVGTTSGNVYIKGDLYVQGTQFQVDSIIVNIGDKVIGIATTCTTDTLLDGAGIGIGSINPSTGLHYHSFTFDNSNSALKSSENLNLVIGKTYKINGTDVLTSTTLGSSVINSSLTSVGTLGQLNVSGISTFSGITTHTTSLFGTQASFTGVVTALSFRGNASSATYATTAGIATYATSAGIATYATSSGIATYAPNSGIATYASTAGIATYATSAGISTYASIAGVSTNATYATTAGIATYASIAGVSTNATYATSAGIATYATSSGIATYAPNSGIATYASTAGVSTNATYATSSGIATYSTSSGVSTSVIGGIASVIQLNVSGVTTTSTLNVGTGGTVITTTATGLVGIGTTNPTSKLQVERYGVSTGFGTFVSTAGIATDIDAFTISSTDFKTVEYTLHFSNGSNIQSQKVLVMQNGTTAYSQEYAIMFEPNQIVSIGATVSSGICKLQATPESGISGLTTYRIVRGGLL